MTESMKRSAASCWLGEAVRRHLVGWLSALQDGDAVLAERRGAAGRDGLRLVHDVWAFGPSGVREVVIVDFVTGEVLAGQGGTSTDPDAWDESWIHVDALEGSVPPPVFEADAALPPLLREFLDGLGATIVELDTDGLRNLLHEINAAADASQDLEG